MTEEQEYIKFIAEVNKKCEELQKEFNALSEGNKKTFMNQMNVLLKAHGISCGIDFLNEILTKIKA